MKAFYDAYGEEAYREVYGPYEQQLGYGLFYNDQGPLDKEGAEQFNGNLQEGPTSMAFGSQSNLGKIPGDKPVTRGRSTVRSAARKMKRSLSRKKDKKQSRTSGLNNATSYQSTEHHQSHQDNKSIHSRSMTSRSRGVDSSTKQSSANGNSDGAAFHFVPSSNGSNYTQEQDQEQQWNGQPQAFVEPIDTTADAPYYADTPSPMNSHPPSYFDHNQAQQQQWGDGINGYGTSIPSPRSTAPAQHQPIRVTESRLARQRSSNRNNKQSVDLMLRRMRSESTEEIESRSAAANQW